MNSDKVDEKEIFNAARQIVERGARERYVREACREDEELFARVQRLLKAYEDQASFLESPVVNLSHTIAQPVTETVGDTIGPFKLLQQIGEGGMGVVYMAEQAEPVERRVALKIIKPGMDTRQVIARFEAERQALAMMDHPNIAKVLDAGTTATGRPYFVMELVKGTPITNYCDEHNLTPHQRLELFVPVCQAIQHAHQKGIIHRDVKPSNVLVAHYDDRPIPKVIDFGGAKAIDHRLTEKTMFTEYGQVLGTIEYMSPEQARFNQWDVDTRSDVYSLGVLLYELLSGETPFDRERLRSGAFDEILRIIREEEPPRPSTRVGTSRSLPTIAANRKTEPKRLSTLIHGELDWIVMKALEKDRTRRYETVSKFAEDVSHYLNNEAVEACPPSTAYRLRKFVRRNKPAIASLTAIAAALVIGAGVAIWQKFEADVERDRAVLAESKAQDEATRANDEASRAERQALVAKTAREHAEEAREDAEYWQYASNIPAAYSFLRDLATGTARNILKNTPRQHRNFEWALLANRAWPPYDAHLAVRKERTPDEAPSSEFWKSGSVEIVQELFPANGQGGLNSGCFANHGGSIFFSQSNGLVKEVSIADGATIGTFSSTAGNSLDVVLSPTGTRLAGFTFSNRGTVWAVDGATESVTSETSVQGPPWMCRWSPDEKHLITGHMDGTLRVWDAASLAFVKAWNDHSSEVTDVFMPKNGELFWSASNDGGVIKRTFPQGKIVAQFHIPLAGELDYQAISPSGTLACAVFRDGSHLLWDIQSEKVVHELGGPSDVTNIDEPRIACSFSPDESCVVVTSSTRTATIYDVASGESLGSTQGNGLPIRGVSFSPRGKLVMTFSFEGTAQVWTSRNSGGAQLANAHSDVIYQLDIDAKHDLLLLGSFDSKASLWNLRTNQQLHAYTGHNAEIMAVDLHPNLPTAATLDATGEIHVWNTGSGRVEYKIDPESDDFADHVSRSGKVIRANFLNFPATMSTGIFTPDGNRIVAHHQGRMRVFDAHTGDWVCDLDHATFAGWPVYSYDSSLVAILEMYGKSLGVWNLETGAMLHRSIGLDEAMVMIDFSPVDNRLVTGAIQADVKIWDAVTGELDRTLKVQSGNIIGCHFSQDGKYVLTGASDSAARVWNSRTGELVTTLIGHNNRIRDVRFNPDQTRLLSWSMDNRAIIWDVEGPYANQLLVLGGDSKLIQACWTDDGRDIVTAWSDGKVEVWRGASKADIANLPADGNDFENTFSIWQGDNTNAWTH